MTIRCQYCGKNNDDPGGLFALIAGIMIGGLILYGLIQFWNVLLF